MIINISGQWLFGSTALYAYSVPARNNINTTMNNKELTGLNIFPPRRY